MPTISTEELFGTDTQNQPRTITTDELFGNSEPTPSYPGMDSFDFSPNLTQDVMLNPDKYPALGKIDDGRPGFISRTAKNLWNNVVINPINNLGNMGAEYIHNLLGPEEDERSYVPYEPVNVIEPANVPPARTIAEKGSDVGAGLAGFVAQLAIAKRLMGNPAGMAGNMAAWEVVNQENGGLPGEGAAMALALGTINAIPAQTLGGKGAKVAAEGGLMAGTTALQGGDTTDIAIQALLPGTLKILKMSPTFIRKTKAGEPIDQKAAQDILAETQMERAQMMASLAVGERKIMPPQQPAENKVIPVPGNMKPGQVRTHADEFEPTGPEAMLEQASQQAPKRQPSRTYEQLLDLANVGDKQAVTDIQNGFYIPSEKQLESFATANPNRAAAIAAKDAPSRKDVEALGVQLNASQRAEVAQQLRAIIAKKAEAPQETTLKGESNGKEVGQEKPQETLQVTGPEQGAVSIAAPETLRPGEKVSTANAESLQQIASPEKPTVATAEAPKPEYGSQNRLVSKADYEQTMKEFVERTRTTNMGAPLDPRNWVAAAKIGLYHFEAGAREFKAWSEKMVSELGETIKPHLNTIWANIQKDGKAGLSDEIINTENTARERGFVTSTNELDPLINAKGSYVPRSTDALAIKARTLIQDDIVQAEKVAKVGTDENAVAVASELIKHYQSKATSAPDETAKNAYYDKAAEIANTIAPKLTELGRSVQAASILSRMTPEGQVRFAAREIQKYNEEVRAGTRGRFAKEVPELTGEQLREISQEMAEINKMTDHDARAERFQKLQRHIQSLVPTPVYKKIVTVWKAGLLTGLKTTGVNLASNATHTGTEIIKDIPATIVDKAVSLFTGQRAVTVGTKGILAGGAKGTKAGIRYIRTGYDERDIGVKLDYKRTNFGKGATAKALQAYTDTVFGILGAEDQPFYYAAKMRSLYEQAKVQAINQGLKGKDAQSFIDSLVQNPTDPMLKYASTDAETAVFINNTKLGEAAKKLQQLPGGEFVVPFGRTPSAIAMQIVNYSPAGIARTIINNAGKGRFDQRLFSQGMGRGLTGTAVLALGASLFSSGIMSLDRPTNEKEQKLWEAEGRVPNSIKINGKWRSVSVLGPPGQLLLIGGQFKRAFNDSGSPSEAMSNALAGTAKAFTEQTFMRGVNQVVDALSDPGRSAASVSKQLAGSTIPTLVGDIARATDIVERRADNPLQSIESRIPGVRQNLQPRIDVLGREVAIKANPLETMIDPTRPSENTSDPIVLELRRLWDNGFKVSPTALGDKTGYKTLSPQQNADLWKRSGDVILAQLEPVFATEQYKNLPDDVKAEFIDKSVDNAKNIARAELVRSLTDGLTGKELADKRFELKKDGIYTESVEGMLEKLVKGKIAADQFTGIESMRKDLLKISRSTPQPRRAGETLEHYIKRHQEAMDHKQKARMLLTIPKS
jgi:hypothetical protein